MKRRLLNTNEIKLKREQLEAEGRARLLDEKLRRDKLELRQREQKASAQQMEMQMAQMQQLTSGLFSVMKTSAEQMKKWPLAFHSFFKFVVTLSSTKTSCGLLQVRHFFVVLKDQSLLSPGF